MNDVLRTLSVKTGDPVIFDVHWLKNDYHGCVQIKINAVEKRDRRIMAELVAIHHLIVNREICGNNRYGNNLVLVVSAGAIRKICLGKSSKTHLEAWSGVLKVRLRDADIMVINTRDWLRKAVSEKEILHIDSPPTETFHMHGLGEVTLTEHLLKRFHERNHNSSYKNAMAKLIEMIAEKHVFEVTLPQKIMLNKTLKHRNAQHIRYFYNTRTQWQFVVDIRPDKTPAVLTAYPRIWSKVWIPTPHAAVASREH